jgi:hypothetical protein
MSGEICAVAQQRVLKSSVFAHGRTFSATVCLFATGSTDVAAQLRRSLGLLPDQPELTSAPADGGH